ncbi:MAG: cell surface protein SprA [Bacteroidales bacterium]|nr:cell surface protein SprA [Bacteroidales bacterium]
MKVKHYIHAVILMLCMVGFGHFSLEAANGLSHKRTLPTKVQLSYPICPPDTNPPVLPQPDINPLTPGSNNPFFLNNPPGIGQSIIYDPETNTYNFQYMTGNSPFGPGAYMNINEYIDYDLQQSIHDYWQNQSRSIGSSPRSRTGSGLIPQLHLGGEIFEGIFGSNTIDIRPSGNVGLKLGVKYTQTDNYLLPVKQRRQLQLDFDEDIQLNLLAKIGEKIEFNLNYSTDELAVTTKTDQIKLKYNGKEDDILQLIEFGDITFPLNSTLISGSQSLFGVKTQLKFGNLYLTAVASRKKGSTQTITVEGGAEETDFYFRADEYEENKHFFIGHFFEEHYNQYLSTLPLVSSPIVITKIEVWRTTVGAATTNNRNIVAFTDLGEYNPEMANLSYNPAYPGGQYPDNNINNLTTYADSSLIRNIANVSGNMQSLGFKSGSNYEKVESARLLSPSEYSVNTKLGFISLNSALAADQVLAVAFQYTVIGDDHVYQVGEFSNEVATPNCIRVKLLKSSNLNTKSPLWKLMMKNVYSLSAYQVSPEKFRLNILYTGDAEGTPNGFFTQGAQKGIALIRLMGLDRLNQQQDPSPDGIFDFIDNAHINGGTINSSNGRIYFPTTEPFGKDLRAVLDDPELADKYAFDSLYTMTKTMAQQITNKNKYYIEGSYRSSYGSEFHFQGGGATKSVKVTAGGVTLTENVDYTVNYDMGVVTIINQGILASGTPIQIQPEVDDAYQTDKRMFGLNLDYVFSPDFTVGATLLNLRERPITNKVNYGDEPINNLIWGMNFAYKTELPFLTKAIDLLTFHNTTTKSYLNLDGEFAHFIPGHSRQIGKSGTTYIDNFESAKSTIDLMNMSNWVLASTPQGQPDLFPEASPVSVTASARRQLAYGYNRARMAWYVIDPLFYNSGTAVPRNLSKEDLSQPYARAVYEPELFPYKDFANTQLSTLMTVFNMAFYPSERGSYNYDVDGSEGFSRGLNEDGTLKDPETRWGGIMRKFDNTDFESSNYEYIEFWMMDPFIDNPDHKGGKLYFNLGDISEDILRDGRKFYENGLPEDGSDSDIDFTVWGRVPTKQMVVNSFDNQESSRQHQDVGYDGLPTFREQEFFQETYLERLAAAFGAGSQAYQNAVADPSADNYHYFRGSDYDDADLKVVERYKYYNNADGNSPTDNQSPENYPTAATSMPNMEDMNNDNTLSEDERYYQYVIDLSPDKMVVGENYINDVYEGHPSPLPDGTRPATKWYQFRIPIHNPDKVVNNMSGFNSIRFMRVFMREFEEPIVCRLATFELVRSSWRTYNLSLREDGDYFPTQDDGECSFYVGTVSLEENANRTPVPYVLPPGIVRETAYGMTAQMYQENEQSVTMKVVDLPDGDSRAIYKSTSYDLRQFNNLQMYIHAEDVFTSGDLRDGEVTAFIRLGSDFKENYYEYEMPIEITPWSVSRSDSNRIWPEKNRMYITLDSLVALKMDRNKQVREGHHSSNLIPFTRNDGENRMTVVGNPNLGEVTTIMIGVRNPKKRYPNDNDDMQPKSVEMWINELRLSGFDDRQGFAALLRARTTLADVGDLTLSGTYSTPGFGSIEQSITQRSHETNINFDLATNIDGGKILFPEKWNIKIPVHYDYSLAVVQPEYNPLNPDVKMKDELADLPIAARDSLRFLTNKVTRRQNVNLMNVRKERDFSKGNTKMHIWDIENLDFSYSYSELVQRDEDMEMNNEYIHHGEIGYTFSTNPKNYRPFSRAKWTKNKWLQLIRDFNFTPMPKNITFRTTLHRDLQEFKYRPKSQGNIIIDTNYVKSFDWTRNYAINWDIFQSLKLEFKADASARIDEPDGRIDTRTEKDSVWRCLGRGGRTTDYRQTFNATYQVPINKIPLFKFVSANVRYSSMYMFNASALSLAYLGNTIQNSQNIQGNASLNFVTLYNSVPYLKKVNQGIIRNNTNTGKNGGRKAGKDDVVEEVEKGKKGKGRDKNDSLREKPEIGRIILDGTLRLLMSVRNVSATFSQGRGTVLPGYMHSATLVGHTKESSGPGFLFMFGGQPDIQTIGARNHWLTTDSLMNTAYQRTKNQVINFRATVEPFRDFRIDVSANRNFTENFSEYFHVDELGNVSHYTPQRSGSFSMTYCGLGTFFKNHEELFQDFRAVRAQLSERYAEHNPNYTGEVDPETGFPVGYSAISQDVLMGAFFTTYLGKDAKKADIFSPFLKIPLPNWRVNYNGLTKIKGMEKVFQSFSLIHNYTCNYNVGGYSTNIAYTQDANGFPTAYNTLGDFIATHELSQMALTEQFAPLIGFDMTLKNSMLLKVEYKQSRNLSLSFANTQITETTSKEVAVSAGYRFKDIKIGLVFSGMKRQFVSDLNVTAGFGLKDNQTMLRRITEDDQQVTSGALNITINAAADYQFSRLVGLKFYYNHTINKPKNKNQYNNMNFETGIELKLMLSQ